MRTKVLLIINIYYLLFIFLTALLNINNIEMLNNMPFLSLVHGNITDVMLYLVIFINSIVGVLYLFIYIICRYRVDYLIILKYINIFSYYYNNYIDNIYHPPKVF